MWLTIFDLVCLQYVQWYLQEVEDHQEIWSHRPRIQMKTRLRSEQDDDIMSSSFFLLSFLVYTFCSSIWVRSPSQRRWAWCIRVRTWMCAFVWVLKSRPFFRSTKEMWRFGLNSPCVCTNETVILIVHYLWSCMMLQGREEEVASFPWIPPRLCFCIQLSSLCIINLFLLMLLVCLWGYQLLLHSSSPRLIIQEQNLLGVLKFQSDICKKIMHFDCVQIWSPTTCYDQERTEIN